MGTADFRVTHFNSNPITIVVAVIDADLDDDTASISVTDFESGVYPEPDFFC